MENIKTNNSKKTTWLSLHPNNSQMYRDQLTDANLIETATYKGIYYYKYSTTVGTVVTVTAPITDSE